MSGLRGILYELRTSPETCSFFGCVPVWESANRKHKCEIFGAFSSKARKLRHFQSFHSDLAIAKDAAKFDRLASVAVYPPPRETWAAAFDCSQCEAFFPNIALLRTHSKKCPALATISNSHFRCELCRAIIPRNKWEPHLYLPHSKGAN